MWQNWLSGFFGLAVILVIWLNISLALEHWFLFALGLAIAGLNFWVAAEKREKFLTGGKASVPPIVN